MVVVPFTGNRPREKLIDTQIALVEVDAFFAFVFAAAMRVVVEIANAARPQGRHSEEGARERMPADQEKHAVPKRPIQRKMRIKPRRMADRAPRLILRVRVRNDAGVIDQTRHARVIFFGKIARDRLVELAGEETIKAT